MKNKREELFEAICEHFSVSDIKHLCFILEINFDDLEGNTLKDNARELILLCERKKNIAGLVAKCQTVRPALDWYKIAGIRVQKPENLDTELPPGINDVLDFAIKTAIAGGRIAKDYYSGRENTVESSEEIRNLTTLADQEANKEIVSRIRNKYGQGAKNIISEEGGKEQGTPQEHGYTWVIDAIDGTVNFYYQMPVFCTAVGVLWNKKPVIGVIYDPISQDLFYAKKEGGAYIRKGIREGDPNDKPLYTRRETEFRKAVVSTHLSSRRYARERFTTSGLLDALANASRNIRAFGSGQLSLAHVAQGRFHAFVNNSTNSWDQVAGLVIVEEAGGIVTNFHGEPWSIDSESIIASANQDLHNQLVAIISAIYPFEGPIHRLRILLQRKPQLEGKLIEFIKNLAN